ncbi:PKD domain-containing protein [bacterium]|nr:MAG: PKD domain-containing protein [bacterium]
MNLSNNNNNFSVTYLTITNGSASYGGGIYCHESSPSLENVTIIANSGGIYCIDYSSPSLENVTITDNSSTGSGGGIYCTYYSSPSLKNVTITGNFANSNGGGIFCRFYSSLFLVNVTITGNSADEGGGIFCYHYSDPSLKNCILWNDCPQEIYFYEDSCPSAITISYSDIQGGESGIVTNNNGTLNWLEGNIDADPLFLDPANGDYHLTENSPCINAGDPESPLDPDGTIADMGAYYYDQSNAPLCAAFYADKTVDIIPAIISFFDQSSPIGTINSWLWDFGDETTETIKNPVHTYNEAGIYTVSLIVSNLVCSDTLTYDNYITVYPNTSLIWPGDTNYSGSVDEADIDAIAIYFREQGTPRDIVSFEWIGNDYPTGWEEPFASLADCNGDGEVNITDVLAICLNWNKTHSTVLESPFIPNNLEQYRDNFVEIYNSLGNSEIEIKIRNHIAEKFDLPIIEIIKVNKLYQNYPNPFSTRGGSRYISGNPETTISFSIKQNSKIELEIFNVKGQKVKTLINEFRQSGNHSIFWNGDNAYGNKVSSGLYFYKLSINGRTEDVKKCLLVK